MTTQISKTDWLAIQLPQEEHNPESLRDLIVSMCPETSWLARSRLEDMYSTAAGRSELVTHALEAIGQNPTFARAICRARRQMSWQLSTMRDLVKRAGRRALAR